MRAAVVTTAIVLVVALTVFVVWQTRDDNGRAVESPPTEVVAGPVPRREVIGLSVAGRAIDVYTFGKGAQHLVFIGGIHGGYEWNSVLLAYKFIDYFKTYPDIIPENLTVSVIPSANTDGLYKVTGQEGRFAETDVSVDEAVRVSGRFNANNVDLNRNFDCRWQAKGTWRGQAVSAGAAPFSEPEAKAIKDFVLENTPVGVVFWHSQANAVYGSECEAGILPETLEIMEAYSLASGYPALDSFGAYEVTGDAEGWLASMGIPALTVELKTHQTIDWDQNLAGVKALFEYYRKRHALFGN